MASKASPLGFADELVQKLCALVPEAANGGKPTAVHQCRVATRRLKSALTVFAPITSRSHHRELSKILKKLRRSLGPVRDLDVMLEILSAMQTSRHAHAADWVIAELTTRRDERFKSKFSKLDPARMLARLGAWWGVKQEWTDAADSLDCLIAESVHLQLDRFIEHANGLAAPDSIKQPGRQIDPHQLRIAGKELRYTLELAVASGHRSPASIARSFKKMQDQLGTWHDCVVLGDQLLKLSLEHSVGHHNVPLQVGLLALMKTILERSEKQLRDFSRIWTERGPDLTAAIRRAFPLTQELSISEMDLDPIDSNEPEGSRQPLPAAEPSAV